MRPHPCRGLLGRRGPFVRDAEEQRRISPLNFLNCATASEAGVLPRPDVFSAASISSVQAPVARRSMTAFDCLRTIASLSKVAECVMTPAVTKVWQCIASTSCAKTPDEQSTECTKVKQDSESYEDRNSSREAKIHDDSMQFSEHLWLNDFICIVCDSGTMPREAWNTEYADSQGGRATGDPHSPQR